MIGPTLTKLEPFAKELAPAQEASRSLFKQTTPIFKHELRPLAHEILPVVNQLQPSLKELGEAFPGLASSFSVFNEFFNELAYNPGPNKGGFMFFLLWANHDLNSVLSMSDAHGALGRTLAYLNCEVLPIAERRRRSQRHRATARGALQPAERGRMRGARLEPRGRHRARPPPRESGRARHRARASR